MKKIKWIIIVGYIFIFVGFLGLLMVFLMTIHSDFLTLKFTIYKIECHNETDSNVNYCSDKNEICNWTERMICHGDYVMNCANKNDVEDCINHNVTECIYTSCKKILKENYNYTYKSCVYGIKQVCEKVEVDEIIREILIWVGNECIDSYLGGKKYDSLGNEEKKCRVIENKTYLIHIENINKKYLTKEWLSQNCEMRRCTPCEDLECGNQKCDLYYCGEYIVEVK